MRNLLKVLAAALASLALVMGLGAAPASARANGLSDRPDVAVKAAPLYVQQIVHSKWSDRVSMKVSNYWDGKKGSKKAFVMRGRTSSVKPTRSFYVPKGCTARIATRDHVIVSRRPSGWQNLKSPIYAVGYWQIELWCQTAAGGGGGSSW